MGKIYNRHDILVFIDVTNGNPNGDPDNGNQPRVNYHNNLGLITDVCIKRKMRNHTVAFPPARRSPEDNGFGIFTQQGKSLELVIQAEVEAARVKLGETTTHKGKKDAEDEQARAIARLCKEYYDIRAFGGVLSVGPLKGFRNGSICGPVQITPAQSIHPIYPQCLSITRDVVTAERDKKFGRTMGNKYIIPYGLYCFRAYVSPTKAARTGFDSRDLRHTFECLRHLFTDDRSSGRPEMCVRAIYDFKHVGTQDEANVEQNRREAMLGCMPAHRLFDGVEVHLKDGVEIASSFDDYAIVDLWRGREEELLARGVELRRVIDPNEDTVFADEEGGATAS